MATPSRSISASSISSIVAGVNSWVIDTGSGYHLVPKATRTPQEVVETRKAEDVLKLSTANGIITNDLETSTTLDELGGIEINSRVLQRTPRVLSVHQLVKVGAKFAWDSSGAWLQLNGIWYPLIVQHGVPLLAMSRS